MTPAQIAALVLVPIGLAIMATGGWMLWKGHLGTRLGRFSEPTRLSIAVVGLLLGYHLIAWGLPPSMTTTVAIPAMYWGWVLGVALVWVVGSVWLDAVDKRQG